MIIGKDEKGLLHVVVGPEEIADNLPAKVAAALAGDCLFDIDERADQVSNLFLKGRKDHDRGFLGTAEKHRRSADESR